MSPVALEIQVASAYLDAAKVVLKEKRNIIILQSVTEAWTLQELGDALGVNRRRAHQLIKERGLDQIRVKNPHYKPREKPIRRCRECEQIILNTRRFSCSDSCARSRRNRLQAVSHNKRYHEDPSYREKQYKWQRNNPDKTRSYRAHWLNTVAGKLSREQSLKRQAALRIAVQCLDCGTTLERHPVLLQLAQRRHQYSPLCSACRMKYARARRYARELR